MAGPAARAATATATAVPVVGSPWGCTSVRPRAAVDTNTGTGAGTRASDALFRPLRWPRQPLLKAALARVRRSALCAACHHHLLVAQAVVIRLHALRLAAPGPRLRQPGLLRGDTALRRRLLPVVLRTRVWHRRHVVSEGDLQRLAQAQAHARA